MFAQILQQLPQQLLNGLVLGSTYALFALGFTLMFGVLGVINLTYGFYFTTAAFLALYGSKLLALPIGLALPGAALLAGLIAVLLDAILLTPLRRKKAPELSSLMVTLGATLLLYSLMTATFGTEIRRLPPAIISHAAIMLGGVRMNLSQILIVVTTVLIVAALLAVIRFTRFGLSMRSMAENGEAAELMGVNTDAVVRLVSFISGALGGTAGVLIGLNFNAIQPYMGETMMLKGFAVIIIGGLGDIKGALIAGLVIGVLEVLTAGFISSDIKDAVGFILLVATLWFRPVGLFGRAPAKRA
ncbi:branched-chain amino acid transport system permease protein [Nitrobacteraceae bacterium AZCC 2161]|jgi:branched-chain amino acid transport system permease protein